ncbi:hypothetical protein [Pectinatus frisingensis]|uniref:hypothetical protein n=1 Tax=Pectinatus frisingensis TaxID=865 RepID=UPI0018C5C242|nr:hypothetical protein [Pectinatus frisingensis]
MANGQKIDELFISLGLDLNQLDLDFVTADKTVKQSIARLNSEKKQIKIKTDIDSAKLDGIGNDVDKIKVKEESLNRLLDIQKQKVSILSAVYKDVQRSSGADSGLTRRAETNYLSEQKAAAQLEAELRKLAASRELAAKSAIMQASHEAKAAEAMTAAQKLSGRVNGTINDVSSIAYGGIGGAAASILPKLGLPGIAAAGIGATIYGIASIAKPAATAGESLYRLQQRLNVTTAEAVKMNLVFKMAGQDISDAVPAFMRLDKQLMAAGADNSVLGQTLARFNVSLKDSSGNLLPLNQQLAALAQGYQRAAAAGQEQEFVTQTLGARGAALIPILQDYNELMDEASQVKTTGLLDIEQSVKLARQWRVMDAELGQLSMTVSAALVPVANDIIPEITAGLKDTVQYISDNKDTVKDLASAFSSLGSGGASALKEVLTILIAINKVLDSIGLGLPSAAQGMKDMAKNAREAADDLYFHVKKGDVIPAAESFARMAVNNLGLGVGNGLGNKLFPRQPDAVNAEENAKHISMGNFKSIDEPGDSKKVAAKPTLQDTQKGIKLDSQIDSARYALTHSDMDSQHYATIEALKAEKEAVKASNASQAEKAKAFELADLKIAKAEQDYAKAVRDANRQVSDSLFQLTHNDLQSAVHSAEEQAQTWREQGLNSNLITAELEAKKSKIYEQFENDTMSKINSIWKSSLQNKLDDIDSERRAWIQKGVDEVKATQWAEREKQVTMQQAAQQALKENKQYLDAVRSAMSGEGSYDEKLQQAKLNVLQLMRAKTGMGSEYITPDLMRAYSSAMSFANNNLVRGMETDPLARNADNNAIGVMRGTKMDFNITVGNVFSEDGEGMQKLRESITGGIIKGIEPYLGDSANSYGG